MNATTITAPADSTLSLLGAWYQAQRGLSHRSWRTCAARVETLYRCLEAWYGAGYVELMFLADPSGAWLSSHVEIFGNSDFQWSARKCRTALEARSVLLGGTTTRKKQVRLSWAVPCRPLDPVVGRDLDWRGRQVRQARPAA